MSRNPDQALLNKIDSLTLSEANESWRKAMKSADWRIFAERERYTVKSWRETEGEDIELRRAKLVAEVLDNIEIKIHPFDEIAGRPTPGVIGCATSIDVNGDYMPAIWNDDGEVQATLDASVQLDRESVETLRESARVFSGSSAQEMVYRAWEQIVGPWAANAEAAKLKDPSLDSAIYGQSTSVLSWKKILAVGLSGYIAECEEKINEFRLGDDTDISRLYFWQAAVITLKAIVRHANRYAELAESMVAETSDAELKARLTRIAGYCRRVPEFPARTFGEALQSMVICNVAKMLENPIQNNSHWGRADQYLYDLFTTDIAAGVPLEQISSQLADVIGRWGTQTFVSSSSQKESHQINFGINNIMVGGKDAQNSDVSNELSYLILHVVGLLKLSSPTVCLRWNNDTPDWLMSKAIRTNVETRGGIPLFENDEVVVESYVRDGIPRDEAVEWHSLGCVYPALPTRAEHYGAEGIAAFNLAGLLHLTLHNGRDINGELTGLETGDPRGFKTFDELYEAFFAQHRFLSHRIFRLGAVARNIQTQYLRLPLLSVLGLEASLELGRDVLDPHPDYSLYGVSDRAIIDAADSLTAIKKLVFEDKTLTMEQLLTALDANFDGFEPIRQLCLNAPKYGNADEYADAMVKAISDRSAQIIGEYDNSPFRPFIIAREGLAWHYYGGLGVGALPDGRFALEPLDDGAASPMRGADENGPTAVLNSALASGFSDVSYASVLNQKFSASILTGADCIDKLIAYTQAYMAAGGSHIQYNIVGADELKSAKLEPEEHSDLVVRIGGFSAYFVQLSSAIQDDVIYRTEFQI
jgi:formate C-acetyltransferase